ncbi:MAG: hypothetical protein AAGJ73_04775 [Pseudomonadota bacterium]
MKHLLIAASLVAATGCITTNSGVTRLTSTPPGATATIGAYGECETPCTAQIVSPVKITFAKIGYKPQSLSVAPGRKSVAVELELAAPTENVEETALPEL